MKTLRLLALASVFLSLTSVSSHAKGPRGGSPDGGKRGGATSQEPRTTVLELSTALEISTLSPRMTEEEWQRRFPKKVQPARR